MAFIPALLTPKFSLRRAIPSLNVSTLAAFLRGVAGIIERNAERFKGELVDSKSSGIKPLLVEEVPVELRGCFDFDSQSLEQWGSRGSSLAITRICSGCQTSKRVRVMNVRQSLRQGKLTGLCVSCTSRINASNQPKGRKSHKWKGGKFTTSKGYVMSRSPEHLNACNGYVFEHRLVMEEHLGRYLLKHETVHHKNGIRSDNRIENLELWTKSHGDGYRYQDMSIEELKSLVEMLQDIIEEKEGYEET